MSREQIIRDTAYAIWEAEGKPSGRDAQHWRQAEERVSLSMTGLPTAKVPAKARAGVAADAHAPKKPAAKKKI